MEKGINLLIHEMKENVTILVNENLKTLPVGIVAMCLREVTSQLETANMGVVMQEKAQYEECINEEGRING